MVEAIIRLLGSSVEYLHTREKRKYQDKFLKLRADYYEEANKPHDDVDDRKLSNIKHELKLLSNVVAAELKGQST